LTEKKGFSIRAKLLLALLASLLLAALVFYLVLQLGRFLVWRYYLDENDKQARAEEYVEDFQAYVTKNKLTTDDAEMISAWNAGKYVDLIVYKDSNLIYAPEWFEDVGDIDGEETETSEKIEGEGSESASETSTDKSFYEKWFLGDRGFEQFLTEEARKDYIAALEDALGDDDSLHPVYFVDGTLIVAVVDFTEEMLENVVYAASLFLGLAVIIVIMICYFSTITKRISLLQKNVRIIEEGDLSHEIAQNGNDEIALLASDVGSMRDAIVDNMTRERRAWEANAGLITAMSHDIRTPLTVLLGYLDLMEMQDGGTVSREYISACRDNVLRLKNMSDDMFSYFLVFGKGQDNAELVETNARELLTHVISEYALLLNEKGYALENEGEIPDLSLRIDERYFRRIVDNIFSNITKYADESQPVVFKAMPDGESLILSCENKIRTDRQIPESNGIGLRTCAKMMEEMGGKLSFASIEGRFTVTLTFPLEKKDDK